MDEDLIINAAIKRAFEMPFQWGTADCCTFVCDTLIELGHGDFMAPLRGRYDSEASAHQIVRNHHCRNLIELASALADCAGLAETAFPFDAALLGIVSGGKGPVLALAHKGKWLAREEIGVRYMPNETCVIAWGKP